MKQIPLIILGLQAAFSESVYQRPFLGFKRFRNRLVHCFKPNGFFCLSFREIVISSAFFFFMLIFAGNITNKKSRAAQTASGLVASRLRNQTPGLFSYSTYKRTFISGNAEVRGKSGKGAAHHSLHSKQHSAYPRGQWYIISKMECFFMS